MLGLAASVGVRVMRVGIPVSLGERGCGEGGREGSFRIRVGIPGRKEKPVGNFLCIAELRGPVDAWSTSCVRGGFRGFVEREAWDRN